MKKWYIRLPLIALSTLICGAVALHWIMTGMPFPRFIIEELSNPQQIVATESNGLRMADGSILQVKYVAVLPTNSIFIDALAHGVEIRDDGLLIGLVDVHHWCGNDYVRKHLGRINISALALYLGAKGTEAAPGDIDVLCHDYPRKRLNPGDYGKVANIADKLK